MPTDWIDDADELIRLAEAIRYGPVAVDTESDHFHAYQARVCLIQIATEDVTALVDPLAVDADELAPLFSVFEDSDVPKVLHAAENDILELDRDYGVTIANVFDTRVAARFLACERNGLDWMLENLLEVDTNGEFGRYDWSTRPLSEKARRYAEDDVRHLLDLKRLFEPQLEASGWFRPFRQVCEFTAREVEYVDPEFDPDGWRRLRGASGLDGRGRAAAKALFRWRHRFCTRLNRAAVEVFPNRALMAMARARPEEAGAIVAIDGVSGRPVEKHADELAELIGESKNADPPPESPVHSPSEPPPPEQRALYDELRSWRNDTAKRLDLPPEFIATNDTLSTIAETPPETPEELRNFEAILPWHREMFGDEIVDITGGESAR